MTFANITRNPQILGGKPIIAGTRISVEFLLQALASGMSVQDILQQYPHLNEGVVREALAYAAAEIERTQVEEIEMA